MKFPSPEPARAARPARVKASAVETIQAEAMDGVALRAGRWNQSVTGPGRRGPDHRSAGRRDSGRAGRKKVVEAGLIGSRSAETGQTRTGTNGVDGRPGSVHARVFVSLSLSLSLSVSVSLPLSLRSLVRSCSVVV